MICNTKIRLLIFSRLFWLYGLWLIAFQLTGQIPKKHYNINRILGEAPNIDGVLDDPVWLGVPVATDFTQYVPYNGQPAAQRTEVKMVYDDHAIYVGAILYDSAPDSIMEGLSPRDAFHGEVNADVFLVELNPYNDDQMLFSFHVNAAGVQADQRVTYMNWDYAWDAVWYSEVKLVENGWIAEMKIPFSALRIPRVEQQTWGIHLWRYIKRNEEWVTWNPVNNQIPGSTHQVGAMSGISNIKPPVRLSLTPYLSGYTTANTGRLSNSSSLKWGMDLKYGINESFTLDMMLIPDFGQVANDDAVLNLTSVETYYSEKRSFFTEGTELFSKADVFYSRRIGARPRGYYTVYDQLDDEEVITENPAETQILNVTKLSGRTRKGTGLGFLNALSANTSAKVKDQLSGEIRHISTQPLTNYNVMVVDQALKHNSSVSLINANTSVFEDHYLSNVTGTELRLNNAGNTYGLYGMGAVSWVRKPGEENESGFYYDVVAAKTGGQFKLELRQRVVSDTYQSTDLGYLEFNNEWSQFVRMEYNVYKPFWKIKSWFNEITFRNHNLYRPFEYAVFEIDANSSVDFKNNLNLTLFFGGTPIKKYDFYEPRVMGWKYQEPTAFYIGGSISTDNKKQVSLFSEMLHWKASEYGKETLYFTLRPVFRLGNKFSTSLEVNTQFLTNAIGFVNKTADNDSIFFGRRDIQNIANTWTLNYIFSNKASVSLRARHYWSTIDYKQLYQLKKDGIMDDSYTEQAGSNINYNNVTIDLLYRWQFAPGSSLSLMWKNLIGAFSDHSTSHYFKNLTEAWQADQQNTLSFKILYYLDFQYLKKNTSNN